MWENKVHGRNAIIVCLILNLHKNSVRPSVSSLVKTKFENWELLLKEESIRKICEFIFLQNIIQYIIAHSITYLLTFIFKHLHHI